MQTFADILRHRFLLENLVAKEFKALYRSMALGLAWVIVQPLVLITVLATVWVVFFHAERSFASKVLVCLIPYNFFTYAVSGCTAAVQRNVSLVKKVTFPRQLLPFSVVVTHAIHFACQSLLIVPVLLLFPPAGNPLGWPLLWLPVIVAVQFGLVTGLGLLVSSLNVVYRDVQYIVDSVLTIAFWASPVLYSAQEALLHGDGHSPWLAVLYYSNPLAGILEAYRAVLFYGTSPDLLTLGAATVVTLLLGVVGVWQFWIHEREFADLL